MNLIEQIIKLFKSPLWTSWASPGIFQVAGGGSREKFSEYLRVPLSYIWRSDARKITEAFPETFDEKHGVIYTASEAIPKNLAFYSNLNTVNI